MHLDMSRALGLTVLVALVGCEGTTSWTRTGAPQRPREAKCNFQVFTVPTDGYMEIGIIDYASGDVATISTLGEFKERIRPTVCAAGGDAVIAFANGVGHYMKATVLKATLDDDDPEPPAPAPAPVPAAASGCSYDTQCKGERICQQGVCVDPPLKQ
jgi:hypothetical protein